MREPVSKDLSGLIVPAPQDGRAGVTDTGVSFRRVWYRPDIAALREQFPYPLADYVVQLLPVRGATTYPIRIARPRLDEGPHLGYAIQWFAFAVIGVLSPLAGADVLAGSKLWLTATMLARCASASVACSPKNCKRPV